MDEPNSLKDTQIKIKNFIYYFLRRIEDQFGYYLSYLEVELPTTTKSISLTTNIAAGIASNYFLPIKPIMGKAVGFGVKQAGTMWAKKVDKDTAMSLSDIIYYHSSNEDKVRKILIEAAYELFCCYEIQFLQLTCRGGSTRALQKLGCDAANRYIKYLSKNKTVEINRELIIKSITQFESSLVQTLKMRIEGHHVKNKDEKTWNIPKLYTKVGIYIKENNGYYKNSHSNTQYYGHRLNFTHETIEYIEENYEKDETSFSYTYTTSFTNFEKDYKAILEFIFSKDPLEYAQYDREVKQEKILEVIKKNHKEAENDRQDKFIETKEYLESIRFDLALSKEEVGKKIDEISAQNLETRTVAVPAIRVIQEEIQKNHEKTKEYLETIMVDLAISKEGVEMKMNEISAQQEEILETQSFVEVVVPNGAEWEVESSSGKGRLEAAKKYMVVVDVLWGLFFRRR